MGWKPQTYASRNRLNTISLGSLRMKRKGQESDDEADDEASEAFLLIDKQKKYKSLHEELRSKRAKFDPAPSIKRDTITTIREILENSDRLSAPKRDPSKKRSESPVSRNRGKDCNYISDNRKGRVVELASGNRNTRVRTIPQVTNNFPEKRVQFDLRSVAGTGKGGKREQDVWRDEEKVNIISSRSELRCPFEVHTQTSSSPERSKSGRESKKYRQVLSDDPEESIVDENKESGSCPSSLFHDENFPPNEYVSGGWCIRLEPNANDLNNCASVIGDTPTESNDSVSDNASSPIRSSSRGRSSISGGDKPKTRGRMRGQRFGRGRSCSPETESKDAKNRSNKDIDPFPPPPGSVWKCPLRTTPPASTRENSPNESLVHFDDPRMWRSTKDGPKKEDRNQNFTCSHKVNPKSSSTQDEGKTSTDDFPMCSINEMGLMGNALRGKLQHPTRRGDSRGGASKARASVDFSRAQMLDMYSTDSLSTTEESQRSRSCPLKRRIRRPSEGICASMKQECVETNSQIRLKIESEIKIDIPQKGKVDGGEKKPMGILRNARKGSNHGEDEVLIVEDSLPPATAEDTPYSVESTHSKTGYVGSLVSDQDIVFPERQRPATVPDVREWHESESSDSPLYQTVSPCCESSSSVEESPIVRNAKPDHFKSSVLQDFGQHLKSAGGAAKKKMEKDPDSKAGSTDEVSALPDRNRRGKEYVSMARDVAVARGCCHRKPAPPKYYRKCESTDDIDSNEHRNFGSRGGICLKGERKGAAKGVFLANPPLESKFVAKKRNMEKSDVDYRLDSARSESSIASSSSCFHSNLNMCSQKNTEERNAFFGYGTKLLRQTVKTRYLCKHVYEPSSSNIETNDDVSPAVDISPNNSPVVGKYIPLLHDVLQYLPASSPTPSPEPPLDAKEKPEEVILNAPIECALDLASVEAKEKTTTIEAEKSIKEAHASHDQLLLRGVAIGSSMSWCGPRGSFADMTKSRLYVDNPLDNQFGSSSHSGGGGRSPEVAKKRVFRLEKALKKSVSSGSFTSAHSKVSSSPEETYESCSCPRMYGCAPTDKRTTVASQTDVTIMDVRGTGGSIMNFLDTAWKLNRITQKDNKDKNKKTK